MGDKRNKAKRVKALKRRAKLQQRRPSKSTVKRHKKPETLDDL